MSLAGGRHPGWGTANRIVPLGETYLELVAVVDEAEAARAPFGRWVTAGAREELRLLGWAVRTTKIDLIAQRLGLRVESGSRVARDGQQLRWTLTGVAEAAETPYLPFFIEWARDTPLPGHADAGQRAGPLRISKLQLSGEPDRLAEWLGPHELPIEIEAGPPRLEQVVIQAPEGELTFGK